MSFLMVCHSDILNLIFVHFNATQIGSFARTCRKGREIAKKLRTRKVKAFSQILITFNVLEIREHLLAPLIQDDDVYLLHYAFVPIVDSDHNRPGRYDLRLSLVTAINQCLKFRATRCFWWCLNYTNTTQFPWPELLVALSHYGCLLDTFLPLIGTKSRTVNFTDAFWEGIRFNTVYGNRPWTDDSLIKLIAYVPIPTRDPLAFLERLVTEHNSVIIAEQFSEAIHRQRSMLGLHPLYWERRGKDLQLIVSRKDYPITSCQKILYCCA